MSIQQVDSNAIAIQSQLETISRRIMDSYPSSPRSDGSFAVLNNKDWFGPLPFLSVLRDAGKFMRLGDMLSRDSVKSRLASSSGISFTEFSYQLLQAYDFFHLRSTRDCRLQIGGGDQWGNIISGIDLISRKSSSTGSSKDAFGLTVPLLTTQSGEKFGKSAGNAVWLSSRKTSFFDFYQFFVRTADGDVDKLLRFLTFLSPLDINTVVREHRLNPDLRVAQKVLSAEVTKLVHGEQGLRYASIATDVLFGGDISRMNVDDVLFAFDNDPRLRDCSLGSDGMAPLSQLLVDTGICTSKGEVKKLVSNGGLYVSNKRILDPAVSITAGDFEKGRLLVVRKGKSNYYLLRPQLYHNCFKVSAGEGSVSA
eukprot:Partr_v1_DN26352_c0_g1_i1_m43352 putative tyrosyl-tRNA synthetase